MPGCFIITCFTISIRNELGFIKRVGLDAHGESVKASSKKLGNEMKGFKGEIKRITACHKTLCRLRDLRNFWKMCIRQETKKTFKYAKLLKLTMICLW